MNKPLTNDTYWRESWSKKTANQWSDGTVPFTPEWHTVLRGCLERYRGGTCLELGCFPGRYLHYLHRTFGLHVEGLDTYIADSPAPFPVYAEDFLAFEPHTKYDVVCSFGFIEHFSDSTETIQKHLELTQPGGTLVITVPNFLHGWRFYGRSRSTIFETHNREAMDLRELRRILAAQKLRNFRIFRLSFSKRDFANHRWSSSVVLKTLGQLCRLIPTVDQGLATELILVAER